MHAKAIHASTPASWNQNSISHESLPVFWYLFSSDILFAVQLIPYLFSLSEYTI